ncbi:MAG: hypothetical protein ACD_81C00149G0002 [uncultured bacterium]|uniref:Uncharacterized protein n=2 Tax=Candidatus Wolfeibacteriota TaxID=1752735 RepID=A0A0G1H7A6_9BACT|nr:MAG: hypothetical protein ACD_81C00149G0002 [uncultured bacterium]KKR12353.1 MAG: hypothetical protein UT41_C0002G0127 [Candidatus Wolfebacteria bacterium GW2011_GWC2_39_22]KKT43261.1 MAG: hypothetical protein UW32_C0002G0122 [Candidatus Wolfebacteria bacterium GW2011_GWE2_44_13]
MSASVKKPKILIVYPVLTEAENDRFCIDLRVLGYDTYLMTSVRGLDRDLGATRYAAVIISKAMRDPHHAGSDGYSLASRIKKSKLAMPVIVLDPTCGNAEDCMRLDTGVRVIPDTARNLEYVLAELFYPERVERLRIHAGAIVKEG